MAGRTGGRHLRGGILGLLDLLDDPATRRAIERDLIGLGLRLRWLCDGTDRINWRDLHVIVMESDTDSRLIAVLQPDFRGWDVHTYLLAEAVDALVAGNWQRGNGKRHEIPKPLPRPKPVDDTTEELNPELNKSGRYVGETDTIANMADWLGWDTTLTPA